MMWLTALVIGFAGSMHCLGMCSPLAMAVTSRNRSAFINRALYNGGRISTYALMGALVSGLGAMLPLSKYQNIISIVMGLTLLLIGVGAVREIRIPGLTWGIQRLTGGLKLLFAEYLQRKNRGAIVMLGALNGLLPCGLTFIALTWCVSLRGPLDGFNFMLLFGAGTLPVMLGFTSIIPALARKLNWSLQKLTTTMLILSGCVLILRVFIIHIPHAQAGSSGFVDIILCR